MSKVEHLTGGGNVVIKGNKRTTTQPCGCKRREKEVKGRWRLKFEFICPSHMGTISVHRG